MHDDVMSIPRELLQVHSVKSAVECRIGACVKCVRYAMSIFFGSFCFVLYSLFFLPEASML